MNLNNIVILGQVCLGKHRQAQVAYKIQGKHGYGLTPQSVRVEHHAQPGQQNVAEGQICPLKLLQLPAVLPTFFPELLMWWQRTGCALCALAVIFWKLVFISLNTHCCYQLNPWLENQGLSNVSRVAEEDLCRLLREQKCNNPSKS